MKKFLSLVLALVMTMSLVTIGAGAKEFTDDEKITYEEAVNVISTIGVVDGYEDGSFNPQGALTRGAAAKIICNMILGPTTAAELRADTAPFKDVPTDHTFAGYIAYCAKEGIISGYADGSFRPSGTLTGYAFMKMLLGALGYDATTEGYVGANWSINVAKQALAIGLNKSLDGDFNGVKAVNREEACLYAFNTLKADLVDYETIISTTINGEAVNIGNSKAKAMQWLNSATRINNIKNDEYIQFAEQYFPKLVLTNDTDVFGRPTREWEFKGKDIGEYVNTDLLVETYSKKVTGKVLYELLGKSTVDDYDFDIYIDGETEKDVLGSAYFTEGNIVKTNTEKVGATGNGVTTEVYVDVDAKEVTIAIINTYVAVADDDYNEKKEEASFTVWGIDDAGNKQYVKDTDEKTPNMKVKNDDINVEDIEDDDVVLVTVADGEIQTIARPDVLDAVTITKFSNGDYITTGGTQYDYADTAMYDDDVLNQYDVKNMKDTDYNVYLDQYGYLIGIEIVEEADLYLFLTGIESAYSNLANRNVDANVVFMDGTMETITVNTGDSDFSALDASSKNLSVANTWCKYSVDKNGVYTLEEIAYNDDNKVGQSHDTSVTTIDKKHIALDGQATDFTKVYGNDNTVYLTVSTKHITADDSNAKTIIIDDVDTVSTGIQSTSLSVYNTAAIVSGQHKDSSGAAWITGTASSDNTSHGVYVLFKNNGYVLGAVVVGEDDGTTSKYVYVTSDEVTNEGYDSTEDEWTWSRKVWMAGEVEEIELIETGSSLSAIGEWVDKNGNSTVDAADKGMKENYWYEVKFYADGTVRSTTLIDFSNAGDKFIDNIDDVDTAVLTFDTVVLFEDMTAQPYELTVKGNTLYADTSVTVKGFPVHPDAKITLIQDKKVDGTDDKDPMAKIDVDSYSSIEKAVKALNDNENFKGYIGAIIEEGIATSVVIYDRTATLIDTGITTPVVGIKVVDSAASNNYVGAELYSASGKTLTSMEKINALANTIEDDGYDVIRLTSNSLTYVDGKREITIYASEIIQVYAVTVKLDGILPDYFTISADKKYASATDSVNVTIKTLSGSDIASAKQAQAAVDGTALGRAVRIAVPDPASNTATVSVPMTGINGDVVITVSNV